LYSPGWPHLGQVSVCVLCSVVSLKKSFSSMTLPLPWLTASATSNHRPQRRSSFAPADFIPYSSLP
jgi:hypothetical protein